MEMKSPIHNPPHDPTRHNLTSPSNDGSVECQLKRIRIVWVRKRKVRVDIFIRAEVQGNYLAQEREHGYILGDATEEERAANELLVFGVFLTIEANQDKEFVDELRHGEWRDDD